MVVGNGYKNQTSRQSLGPETSKTLNGPDLGLANYIIFILLTQEFIPEIKERGEFSLIYFNSNFSHAVRKFNKSGDFRINTEYGGDFEHLAETDKHLEILKPFAGSVIHVCPFKNLLYSR